MTDHDAVIDELMRRVPDAIRDSAERPDERVPFIEARTGGFKLDPAHCVLATRVGVDVLTYFGLPARERLVTAWASNAVMTGWLARGQQPETPDAILEAGGWTVAIDTEPTATRRFPGHLVATVEPDVLLDLNSGQFARPAKDLIVPPTFAAKLTEGLDAWTSLAVFNLDCGGVIAYEPSTHLPPSRWRGAPDWKRKTPITGRLIRAIREELGQ